MIFLRGIGCNWLVCLACYFGIQGRDLTSKIVGIWWPIFAFVSLGFDHVVANMTFIPMAIWVDAPTITAGLYIWKGIIPTLLGNIIGGALFVGRFLVNTLLFVSSVLTNRLGAYYWYMYLLGADSTTIHGLGTTTPNRENIGFDGKSDDLEAGGAAVLTS